MFRVLSKDFYVNTYVNYFALFSQELLQESVIKILYIIKLN